MPYTKAISPVSNSYLTKGKEYEILELDPYVSVDFGNLFNIIGDDGEEYVGIEHNSTQTNGLSWQLK